MIDFVSKAIAVCIYHLNCILLIVFLFCFAREYICMKFLGSSSCDYCDQNTYATTNMVKGQCSTTASCYNGQCWAYCSDSLSSGSWCYTTRGKSQNGQYVSCTRDSQCNPCWNCAGSCGV